MLVVVKLGTPIVLTSSRFCNSWYDANPVLFAPRDSDGIPESVWKDATTAGELNAGYTFATNGVFYMTCGGNWVFLHKDGKHINAGGKRKGIPWAMVGLSDPSEVISWAYERSFTEAMHPMHSLTHEEADTMWKMTLDKHGIRVSHDRDVNRIIAGALFNIDSIKEKRGYKLRRYLTSCSVKDTVIDIIVANKKIK